MKLINYIGNFFFLIGVILVLLFLFLLRFSCRWRDVSLMKIREDSKKERNVILFCWHCNTIGIIPFTTKYNKKYRIYTTFSNHKSTKIMRYAFKILGARIINGSKHSGYIESVKNIMKVLSKKTNKKPNAIVITPDGPRGPSLQISSDVLLKIVKKTNTEVRFLACCSSKIFEFNTYEKNFFYRPFSKCYFVDDLILSEDEIGEKNPEELRKICEERMYSAFCELRKICNLKKLPQGKIKMKRYKDLDRI